jgi:hypothetical protein
VADDGDGSPTPKIDKQDVFKTLLVGVLDHEWMICSIQLGMS